MQARYYKADVTILKRYGHFKLKLTLHKTLRLKGYEKEKIIIKGSVNDTKLDENVTRAKSAIFELAYCNDWDYFCTFTLDEKKFNRYDLEKYHRAFSQWVKNQNKKHGLKIKYLTIPETHKDGAWHLHGFINGLPRGQLRAFTLNEKIPMHIRIQLMNDNEVFDWPDYREKFGWVNLEPIENREAVSKYVTKYISKNLARSVKEINAHLYYCSKGLNRAEEIKRGILRESIPFEFENDYVKVTWLDDLDKAINLIN